MSITPQAHAKYSPSAAHRWMLCPGSVPATAHVKRTTNNFADEGTAAHELLAWCLSTGRSPWDFEMYELHIYDGKCCTDINNKTTEPAEFEAHSMWVVDQEMIEFITETIDQVMEFMEIKGAMLLVEQKVDFSSYLGVPDQFGTADVVILTPDEIIIIDLKYGRGVQVDAPENKQLMLYALGALNNYSLLGDFKRVRMVISQPRKRHFSEWDCTIEDLLKFANEARYAVKSAEAACEIKDDPAMLIKYLLPGKEQCQWCPIKDSCPALNNHIFATVTNEDFIDMTSENAPERINNALAEVTSTEDMRLAFCMDQVGLIEGWCKAIRAAVFNKLMGGEPVEGYKIVRGRKGARKWADELIAEKMLVKSMKIKHEDAYKKKLISPTDAIKLLKDSKKRLNRIEPLIVQSEGSLSVAPESDKRHAIDLNEVEFEDLSVEKEESLL